MELRPILINHVAWKIGCGDAIYIYSQPWWPGWQQYRATSRSQREANVSTLLDPGIGNWDFQKLQSIFGFSQALTIATLESVTPSPHPAPDTLFFTYAKDGNFTIKKAYQLIREDRGDGSDRKFWDWVWTGTNLTPKLKVFLWRCVRGALPVRAILASRMRQVPATCPICNSHPETIMHALFHCDFAARF